MPQPVPRYTATVALRQIDLIVVHCSASPSGKRLGGGLGDRRITATQVIDTWHANRVPPFRRDPAAVAAYNPGLPHIGYHYVVDLDGATLTGRRLSETGAHAGKAYNARSIGICLVGGAEPQARYTRAQWDSLRKLVVSLQGTLPDGVQVLGHRDLSPDADGDGQVEPHEWLKTCPGFDVQAWVRNNYHPDPQHVLDAASLAEADHA